MQRIAWVFVCLSLFFAVLAIAIEVKVLVSPHTAPQKVVDSQILSDCTNMRAEIDPYTRSSIARYILIETRGSYDNLSDQEADCLYEVKSILY